MNDDHSPVHDGPVPDELVSAVLDGEATPDERALVEGSPEGRRRLEELRSAAEAVGAAVPPLEPATSDALVARAVAAAPGPATTAPEPAPDELARRREVTAARRPWRRLGAVAAIAAAVLVVVVGVAALAQVGTRSSTDSASSSGGDATASTNEASATAEAAAPVDQRAPADLGALDDAEAALDRYVLMVGLEPSIDHQFELGEGAASSTTRGGSASDATGAVPSCPLPPAPIAALPGDSWSIVATGELPGGPVVVMEDGVDPPTNRVIVVDLSSCTVLAERMI